MLLLPLDHPEPFAAVLGVMVYPGVDGEDPRVARAFAARWLAEPLRQFHLTGRTLDYSALAFLAEANCELPDCAIRWEQGMAIGELFKTLYILAKDHPRLASWKHAMAIYSDIAKGTKAARSYLNECLRRFRTVAHLWAAWSIREGRFELRHDVGYDGWTDFQSFLSEAEILRDFGQTWCPSRSKAKPFLPTDVWRTPIGWEAPTRQSGWPDSGQIPNLTLPSEIVTKLRASGRPRRSG